MTLKCCVCHRVKDSQQKWRTPESDASAAVSHTYCPRCLETSMRAIHAETARANRTQPVAALR